MEPSAGPDWLFARLGRWSPWIPTLLERYRVLLGLSVYLVVFATALLVRLAFARVAEFPGHADPAFYYTVAQSLVNGRGFEIDYIRWETTEPTYVPYLGKWARPLPGQLHIQEVLTASGFRRRGIDSAGAIQSLHCARARGLRQSITLVAWWNTPSRRVAGDKAGHQARGTIGYWNLGPWRRHFADRAVRFDTKTS